MRKNLSIEDRWTAECEEAFKGAKEALMSKPVLLHPDFEKPFILDVDSSKIAVGAVLSQVGPDGKEHPVCYFSKKFGKAESKWDSIYLEAMGLIKALDFFRPYIYGRHFLCRTDSMALTLPG